MENLELINKIGKIRSSPEELNCRLEMIEKKGL